MILEPQFHRGSSDCPKDLGWATPALILVSIGTRERDNKLPLFPQSFNTKRNDVTFAKVDGRFLSQTHTGRCSGGDDVSRLEAHKATEVADQMGDAKHHRARISVLVSVAIHV